MDFIFSHPTFYAVGAAIIGLIVGSFLNVVIHRLPIMMERQWKKEFADSFPEMLTDPYSALASPTFNLSIPRSHCPSCQQPVKAIDNIPVLSWVFLAGKCRYCQTKINFRYPAVELLTAIAALTCALTLPVGWWSVAVIAATFVLIALIFIDADTMLLPDQLTLPLLWAGIALAAFELSPISLTESVVGAMAGYLSLWSVFWLFKLITGKEGMGYGDFKLLAALGAWLGWQQLPMLVLFASFVGAVIGLIMQKVIHKEESRPFAFGPYLAIAGWICLLWGESILNWYLSSYLGM